MSDYAKLKNAELEGLLKERGIPHTGKKAELVARLVESDKATKTDASAETSAAAHAPGKTSAAEDEIDWDDDATAAPATTMDTAVASREPAAVALAAGGKSRIENPTAVPNQEAAIDPSTTDDLTVAEPTEPSSAAAPSATTTDTKPTETPAPTTPVLSFASNLPATDLEAELAKRKARAAKFGIVESGSEATKALERAKRFATGATADATPAEGSSAPTGVSRLDQALPERRERGQGKKRERPEGAKEVAKEGAKRTKVGGEAFKGGKKGTSAVGPAKAAPPALSGNGTNGARKGTEKAATPKVGAPTWMTETDRQKAEARKAKFATQTSS